MPRNHWKYLPEGSHYGSLVVMKRPSGTLLECYENLCQCDCGKRVIVTSHMLATGKQTDCGCVFRDRKRNDIYPERLKGLDNLANAIMHRAAMDYRIAFNRYLKKKDPSVLADLRRFFRSEWGKSLTELDTDMLMNRIEQECIIEFERKKKKHGNKDQVPDGHPAD
jgi:hypothetical protein